MEKILIFLVVFAFSIASYGEGYLQPLRIPLHAAKITLDPSGVQDLSSLLVSRQVNCQLVRSYSSVISLEAAEAIHFITPTTLLITLKKNAAFQDGSTVTGEDVVASMDHLKKSRRLLRNLFAWIKKIEIINSKQIRITLTKSVPQFLYVIASPNYAIFKKDFLVKAEKDPRLWQHPLGCGHYKIVENTPSVIKLSPQGGIGRSLEFYLTQNDQMLASDLDKYDIADLHLVGRTLKNTHFRTIAIFDPTQIYVGLNSELPRWKNKETRCGFLSKLNIHEIVKQYGGEAKQAKDILPEGILGYSSSLSYLEEINQKYNSTPIMSNDKFCLSYLSVSIPEEYRPAYLKMIQHLYSKIHTTTVTDNQHFAKRFIDSKCDALVLGLKSNTLDGYDILAVFSEAAPNFTGISSQKIAQEIEASQNETDPKIRSLIYRKLVRKIEDNCLVYPILTIPMKLVYIRNDLNAPDIGKGPLNEYDLGKVL